MVWENTFIKITTEPSGAKIYLNDNYKGISPLIIRSTPGTERTLKLELEGYKTRITTIRWPSEGTRDYDYVLTKEEIPPPEPPPLPEIPAEWRHLFPADEILQITSTTWVAFITTPDGAQIHVDDVPVGTTNKSIGRNPGSTHTVKFSKVGYKPMTASITWPVNDIDLQFQTLIPEEEPEYPKDVTRGPYTISVDNALQEAKAKEFLGIEPPGDDLDTWLSKRDLAGLEEWKSYWTNIFAEVGMSFWISFVNDKFEEYKAKLPPVVPPERTWWEKILDTIGAIVLFPFTVSSAIVDRIMFEITGERNTEDVWAARGYEAISFLTPLDELSKLFFSENLAGEPAEFIPTDDTIGLIIDSLVFIPIGKIGKVGLKLGEKMGAKGLLDVAGKAGLKKATPEAIEALLKSGNYKYIFEAARTDPGSWAKLAPKLSKEAQAVISAGLKKQHPNAAYRLFEESILNAERAKVPLTTATLDWLKAHKGTTLMVTLGGIWGVIGFDAFVNWPLADNIGFLEYRHSEAIKADFLAGKITKEKALEEMDKIIEILEGALAKINVSMNWNPLMIAFGAGIRLTAEENLALAIRTREEIEEEIPPEETGMLIIRPIPTDAKVSVERQIPTTGIFSAEIPIGSYSYVVSKFGYTSKSGTIELTEAGLDFSVEIEKEVVPPEELEEELIISVAPDETEIFISGHPEITKEGTYTLPLGPYTIYFSLEGYRDHTAYATLKAGKPITVSHSMIKEEEPEPDKAELLITSKPSFADVMIDGKSTFQKTPYTAFLDEGMHTIRIELSDYEPEEEEIELVWGDKKDMEFILNKVPPTKGTLRIESDPPGAQIYIDGESKFATTPYTITLLAETYKIRLTKDSYISDETDVIVEAGVEIEHKVKLDKKPITDARITINSDPTGADIYIDGEYQYVTTPFTKLFKPSTYTIRIQKDGYYPETAYIEFEEGEDSTVTFTLTEIPAPEIPPEPYIPQEPYYPTYIPPEPYVPTYYPTPPAELPIYDYPKLYPKAIAPIFYEEPAPPVEKELLINIETTDVKPWKGRIYSIALLDLAALEAEPLILIDDNEEKLIQDFLAIFAEIAPVKLVGFKLTFDHRYIFAKMMLYRSPNKSFKDIEMLDIKQIMDQVQEKFVYFPSKIGTLDDWGKMLLGKGKLGTQELMLRKYLSGDFEYVRAFQLRQMEITKGLYDLAHFVSSKSLPAPISRLETVGMGIAKTSQPETIATQSQKTCPTCKAYNKPSATICEICGAKLR